MIKIFCPIIAEKDEGGGIKSTILLLNGIADNPKYQVHVMLPERCEYIHKFKNQIIISHFSNEMEINIKKPILFLKTCYRVAYYIFKNNIHKNFVICSDRPSGMLITPIAFRLKNIIYISRGGDYITPSAILLRKLLFPFINNFVSVTKSHKQILLKHVRNKEIKVIHNGVSGPDRVKKINTPFSGKIKLSIIGGICDLKNQIDGIKVIEQLNNKNIELHIYGSVMTPNVDGKYFQYLKNFIDDHEISSVFFHGYVSDLEKVFYNTDICLSTSKSEGFGRTIIEAMAYGVPVIANEKSGGPTNIITHKETGMLYNGSISDLKTKITELIEDPKLLERIIIQAREEYEREYTSQKMIKNYINLIDHIYEA